MKLLTNVIFAWISVFFTILLCIIYILRKFNKNNHRTILNINSFLRKHHKIIGIVLIITGLIHGYLSSIDVFSINKGTILWGLSILLGLNFYVRKKIKFNKQWIYYHRILSVLFIIVLLLHIIEVGFVGFEAIKQSIKNDLNKENTQNLVDSTNDQYNLNDKNTSQSNNIYADGTYRGEANGYGPGLIVEVVIENNTITSIEIIDHNERNSRFYAEPIEVIPERIIEAQSPVVDAVSGSTMTSYGIMNAVNDALKDALVSGNIKEIENIDNINKGNGHGFGKNNNKNNADN